MQYCINALLKNNNEIMQYYIINNDIALIMHYRALLQMPGLKLLLHNVHEFDIFIDQDDCNFEPCGHCKTSPPPW